MPTARRGVIEKLRDVCRRHLHGYEECVEYGIPGYKRGGVLEISFANRGTIHRALCAEGKTSWTSSAPSFRKKRAKAAPAAGIQSSNCLSGYGRMRSQGMETHVRSIVKAVSYRMLGSLTTGAIFYGLTGKAGLSVGAGLLDVVLKIGVYFLHERLWNHIAFGRAKPPEYEI